MFNLAAIGDLLVSIGIKLLGAIAIIIIGFIVAGCLSKIILKREKLDASVRSFLSSFVALAVKVLAVISALFALGVPAASFVTVLGSVGLAVGLAMQGALANFAGGILLVVFRPFKVGDHVTLSGNSGVVKNISIFYTTLLSDDNKVITLPNGTLTNAAIVNTTLEDTRRLSIEYTLPMDSDIEAARKALLSAASSNAMILSAIEPPTVNVSTHVEGKITVKLNVWTKGSDYAKLEKELESETAEALDAAGVSHE